jgi:Luciferase-like monooxygenase
LTLGVGLGSDRSGNELSITGEELDDRRRAGMLDEALEILTAAWPGEPVYHRGEHYTVDGMRFLPRPVQRPGVPVWVGGYPGKRMPLRRAVRFQGFFPVDLEHPDQLAEIVAAIASVREEIGRDVEEPFDVVAALPVGTDPAPYASAGATWWMVEFPWDGGVGGPGTRCDPRRTGALGLIAVDRQTWCNDPPGRLVRRGAIAQNR